MSKQFPEGRDIPVGDISNVPSLRIQHPKEFQTLNSNMIQPKQGDKYIMQDIKKSIPRDREEVICITSYRRCVNGYYDYAFQEFIFLKSEKRHPDEIIEFWLLKQY